MNTTGFSSPASVTLTPSLSLITREKSNSQAKVSFNSSVTGATGKTAFDCPLAASGLSAARTAAHDSKPQTSKQ